MLHTTTICIRKQVLLSGFKYLLLTKGSICLKMVLNFFNKLKFINGGPVLADIFEI